MDIERELKKIGDWISKETESRKYPKSELLELSESLQALKAAIARQSIKSEEVAEAIEYVESVKGYLNDVCDHQDPKTYDSLDLAITALQAYQPTISKTETVEEVAISKTETTSCEWCELEPSEKIFAYGMGFRKMPLNFCPNCGRRIIADD